jgi:PKHD-type hydroxylase
MLTIAEVIPREDVLRIREGLADLPFKDGRTTAGAAARAVKRNLQADRQAEPVRALARFIREALERHELFCAYARPARWSELLFSRYGPGDAYGLHVDAATMAAEGGGRLRTDLSFTLFLSDPEDYEGGALLLDGLDGEREARPAAGSLVVYETGVLHRVTPVSRGERLACVGWVQSLVRRADHREVLFDLARVQGALPEGETRLLLSKTVGDLTRMWAEL